MGLQWCWRLAMNQIHVLDPDYRRRASIAHEFRFRSLHVELYENLAEFLERPPRSGIIFTVDDVANGCDPRTIREMMKTSQTTLPIVVYSSDPSTEQVVRAMQGGAVDFLQWPFKPLLLDAVFQRTASEAERHSQREQVYSIAKTKVGALTRRERDVLVHLLKGFSNAEMGKALGISARTIEIHRTHMMQKLGAKSAAEAVRLAIYAGLDDDLMIIHRPDLAARSRQ